jgi:hypothetical protein
MARLVTFDSEGVAAVRVMLAERRPDIVAKRAVKKSQPTCWHAATMWKPVWRLLKTKKNSVENVVGRNYYECKRLGSGRI